MRGTHRETGGSDPRTSRLICALALAGATAAAATEAPPPPLPEPAAPPIARRALSLSLLAGAVVPRVGMQANVALGVEGAWRLPSLPLLADRLEVTAGLGWALLRQTGSALVAGRGYDPALVQNSTTLPLDLGVRARLFRFGPAAELSAAVAYELMMVWTRYLAFGAESRNNDAVAGASFAARIDWPLGPGSLVAELRHSELTKTVGRVEPASAPIGEPRLSGTRIAAGYALRFF